MNRSKRFNRRTLLRGAGSVAIALPLAATLRNNFASAAPGAAPHRYVSLFFGNGLPKSFVQNGYTGVLAPLSSFENKLAMIRGIELPETGGALLHYRGTARFGKGVSAPSESSAGGQSLDDFFHQNLSGAEKLLNVNMHTAVTGGNAATRWYHSWRDAFLPNDELLKPLDVFDHLFGNFMPEGSSLTPEEEKQIRYDNSVLDSVIDQYEHLQSDNSGYSKEVRARLADHLDLLRDLEKQAIGIESSCEQAPTAPPDLEPSQACTPQLCPGDDSFYYGSGGTNWNEVWELNCQLYAMAFRCGISRFGTMGCTGGGDRYPIPELNAQGITESPHVLAHAWSPSGENGFDVCVTWLMEKIAYFLSQLDDPAWPDPMGGTVLDNTLVLIGTELGTGGGGQHAVDHMTYFLAGGGGRITPGIVDANGRSDVDLYSTITRAMDQGDAFGNPADFSDHFDIVV
ncbi:MAG: DUF1552 domain-containing protein [Polyangiaceae bacterium]